MAVSNSNQCSATIDDWDRSNSVMDRLQFLLKTSHWSDCTFNVGGQDCNRIFKVHKLLLALSSPVFEAMFFGGMSEKGSINVSDIEPNAFKIMLQFIYTDTVDLETIEDACETLYAAKKYMLTKLVQGCHDFIKTHLSPSNVISVFEFAEALGETDLFQPCFAIISKYTKILLIDPKEHMKPSTISTILKQNILNITEPLLFTGVQQWAQEECQQRGVKPTFENLRAILVEEEVLCNVRFLVFSAKEFSSGPSRSEILTRQEINALWDAILLKDTSDISEQSNPEDVNCDFSKPSKIPDGICLISESREIVPLTQCYCIRSFLKTARRICGSLKLLTKVTVNKQVFMNGVRFFSRLMPRRSIHVPGFSPFEFHSYMENMKISVFNEQGHLLLLTVFKDMVEYSTKATVLFKEPIVLVPGDEYSIYMESLYSNEPSFVEYPAAYLSSSEENRGVVFSFSDYGQKTIVDTFVQRLDMGFLDSVVFFLA